MLKIVLPRYSREEDYIIGELSNNLPLHGAYYLYCNTLYSSHTSHLITTHELAQANQSHSGRIIITSFIPLLWYRSILNNPNYASNNRFLVTFSYSQPSNLMPCNVRYAKRLMFISCFHDLGERVGMSFLPFFHLLYSNPLIVFVRCKLLLVMS